VDGLTPRDVIACSNSFVLTCPLPSESKNVNSLFNFALVSSTPGLFILNKKKKKKEEEEEEEEQNKHVSLNKYSRLPPRVLARERRR